MSVLAESDWSDLMAYILTFSESELASISSRLTVDRRLTKAVPKEIARPADIFRSRTTLVLGRSDSRGRHLRWLGVAAQVGSIGAREDSVTIDPLVRVPFDIRIDGPDGLLAGLSEQARDDFDTATTGDSPGTCGQSVWDAMDQDIRRRYPDLTTLLVWLKSLASPVEFNDADAADRSWQEQKDCADCLVRIFGLPLLALASWQRPESPDATYLSGVVPQPNEQSMIDHDTTATFRTYPLVFDEWREGGNRNIHVLRDGHGRQLEFVNVNNSAVESRTGTDMIYYYAPTHSFVLVQYKRIDSRNDELRVDDRLRDQLNRLEDVAKVGNPAAKPSDWRLGQDPCFLKVAYWPESANGAPTSGVTPGMPHARTPSQLQARRAASNWQPIHRFGHPRPRRHHRRIRRGTAIDRRSARPGRQWCYGRCGAQHRNPQAAREPGAQPRQQPEAVIPTRRDPLVMVGIPCRDLTIIWPFSPAEPPSGQHCRSRP
jgi:hypothetical protein